MDNLWLLVGDFNFYRSISNRNRDGANISDIETFNEVISYQGLVELPIKGRALTWSNMQDDPLLVQLDWFSTSLASTLKIPNTVVNLLARPTSDHVPYVVSVGTSIPKAEIFRFENHWITLPGFLETVESIWRIQCPGIVLSAYLPNSSSFGKGLKNGAQVSHS